MGEKIEYRINVMSIDSFQTFLNVRGGRSGDRRDVYFVRLIGNSKGMPESIQKAERELGTAGLSYYRIDALPGMRSTEDAAEYGEYCRKWQESGNTEVCTRTVKGNIAQAKALGTAMEKTLSLFRKKKGITASMEKNFAVKLLFWFDTVTKKTGFAWNGVGYKKLVALNITKEQEYLFFYLLLMMDCDVLLWQLAADISPELEAYGISKALYCGEFCTMQPEPYQKQPVKKAEPVAGIQEPSGQRQPLVIPPRLGRVKAQVEPKLPGQGQPMVIPPRPGRAKVQAESKPSGQGQPMVIPSGPGRAEISPRREKTTEELAALASSVVMILIHDENGEAIGSGSGIMIGRKGFILTNNHVVAGGCFYSVRIEDDEKIYATKEVIKYNPVLDLAVIRINRELNPIPVYSGTGLVRGQKVFAIGSPLGLFNSVSDGIISGFRTIDNVDMIQFTAPISHGSSGGAVVDLYGEVVGISTAGFDNGQNINLAVGYEAIRGFAGAFLDR